MGGDQCATVAEDLGFPIRRARTYAVALRKETVLWVGPTNNADFAQDLLRYFARVTMLDADAFAQLDSNLQINALREHMARLRGVFQGADKMTIESLLSPTCREEYNSVSNDAKAGVAGCLVADVSQTSRRRRAGAWLPSLQRSSQMVSVKKQHIFTANELNFAMGWPMFTFGDSEFLQKLRATLPECHEGLSQNESRRLQGNGMMLAQVVSFFLYVMASSVRKDVLLKVMMPLSKSVFTCHRDAKQEEEDEGTAPGDGQT